MSKNNYIPHPKFTREENKACKLTEEQISEIKELHKNGNSYSEIGEMYGVTGQAIYYWCLSEEQRRKSNSNKKRRYKQTTEYFKEYRQRKKETHPELRAYERQFTSQIKRETRPNYDELRRIADKKQWIKHKEKKTVKNKEYQINNLDKFRKYNKKHRDENIEKCRQQARESYHRNREKILKKAKEKRDKIKALLNN